MMCVYKDMIKPYIKLIVMDVDGTLTDGRIYMSNTGELFKSFNVKDGYTIKHILPCLGIKTAIITGRESKIVINRAKELNIDYVYQNIKNKKEQLIELSQHIGISLNQIAYIGDDLNDLEVMQNVSISACPSDADQSIKNIATFVCNCSGGNGVVREFVNWLLKCKYI